MTDPIAPPDRTELRDYLFSEWLCGCGNPELATAYLHRALRLFPAYEHVAEWRELVPDEGLRLLLAYQLDQRGLTDHGTYIDGAWLTEKGRGLLAALDREAEDDFEGLLE